MRLKPVIDELETHASSSAPPSSSLPTAKLFSWPRMSVNQSRMNEMSSSSTRLRMSSFDVCGSDLAAFVVSVVAIGVSHVLSSSPRCGRGCVQDLPPARHTGLAGGMEERA